MPCPPPVAQTDDGMDAAGLALKGMYDLYGICAGRLVDLVNFLTKSQQDKK